MKLLYLITIIIIPLFAFDSECSDNCKICELDKQTGERICTQCIENYHMLADARQCINECPLNYYLSEESICKRCHYSCSKCSGNQKSQCLSCQISRELQPSLNKKEGYCYCQNESFISQCILENENLSPQILKYSVITITISALLSIMKRNPAYFLFTLVFYQDISILSYINVLFPLQIQEIFQKMYSIFFCLNLNIHYLFNDILRPKESYEFFGNLKLMWFNQHSSLFIVNIFTYLVIVGLLKLYITSIFLKKLKRFFTSQYANTVLMKLQIILGTEAYICILFEMVNSRLQIKHSLFLDVMNKLVLLLAIYMIFRINWKYLTVDETFPPIISSKIKKGKNQCFTEQKIMSSITISLLFFNPNLQVCALFIINIFQFGYNMKSNFQNPRIKSLYNYLQLLKISIIFIIFYLISFSQQTVSQNPSLSTSQTVQITILLLLKLLPIVYFFILVYNILKKGLIYKKKDVKKIIKNEEDDPRSNQFSIGDIIEPPISNKFSTRVPNILFSQQQQQILSTLNISSHRSGQLEGKNSIDLAFDKTIKPIITQNDKNQQNIKNSNSQQSIYQMSNMQLASQIQV